MCCKARVRRYDSSLEAALFPDNIPLAVFHNLIDVFKRNLPTWHRYWRLRRKVLGVETLHEWDIKAPLTHGKVNVPYAQAVDWICEGMAPLGEEYVTVLRRGCLQERWVDIYPNKGKRLGAFSYGGPGTHPFIMMSYNDDLFSRVDAGARVGALAAFLPELADAAADLCRATRSLRPRWRQTSTRRWCATTCCARSRTGTFRSG